MLALADAVEPRYRALVLLTALGGLRRGDLFGLQRRHVDVTKGLVTVEAQRQQLAHGELVIGPPKSEAGRRAVAVPPQAVNALKAHLDSWTAPDAGAWIFTGDKGGPLRDAVWQHEWDVARRSVRLVCLACISTTYDTSQRLSRLPLAPG